MTTTDVTREEYRLSVSETIRVTDEIAAGHAQLFPTLDLSLDHHRAELVAQLAVGFRVLHRAYPQYDGHVEAHFGEVVRVTKRVRTKGGVAFEAGDLTVRFRGGHYDEPIPGGPAVPNPTLWSWRNGFVTNVPADAVEVV